MIGAGKCEQNTVEERDVLICVSLQAVYILEGRMYPVGLSTLEGDQLP